MGLVERGKRLVRHSQGQIELPPVDEDACLLGRFVQLSPQISGDPIGGQRILNLTQPPRDHPENVSSGSLNFEVSLRLCEGQRVLREGPSAGQISQEDMYDAGAAGEVRLCPPVPQSPGQRQCLFIGGQGIGIKALIHEERPEAFEGQHLSPTVAYCRPFLQRRSIFLGRSRRLLLPESVSFGDDPKGGITGVIGLRGLPDFPDRHSIIASPALSLSAQLQLVGTGYSGHGAYGISSSAALGAVHLDHGRPCGIEEGDDGVDATLVDFDRKKVLRGQGNTVGVLLSRCQPAFEALAPGQRRCLRLCRGSGRRQ
ncbi:MAG TPA: hypothetical protein VF179_18545 [Thermoanaerobaculia bacterium]|nr:hypothetical protein [Thermoanaerobaculia bacterium]